MGCVAIPELHDGFVQAHILPFLELVRGGTWSVGYRQWPPGPPWERQRTRRWGQHTFSNVAFLNFVLWWSQSDSAALPLDARRPMTHAGREAPDKNVTCDSSQWAATSQQESRG
jgi:hypothetical protein